MRERSSHRIRVWSVCSPDADAALIALCGFSTESLRKLAGASLRAASKAIEEIASSEISQERTWQWRWISQRQITKTL